MRFLPFVFLLSALASPAHAQLPMTGAGVATTTIAGSCTAYNNLASRMDGSQNTSAVQNLICGMVTDGTYAGLDLLYVFATSSTTNAKLNWAQSLYNLTYHGTPSESTRFSTNNGYTGDGSTVYLDSGWTPATNAVQLTLNNASIATCILDSRTTANSAPIGTGDGSNFLNVTPIYSTGPSTTYYHLNDGPASSYTGASNAQGSWIATRTASNATTLYFDGSSVTTTTQASGGLTTGSTLAVLAQPVSGTPTSFSTDQVAYAFAGKGFNSTDVANIYSRLATYLTAVGAVGCSGTVATSGPSTGTVGTASTNFTVSLTGATFNGTSTVTIADGQAGANRGTFTPSTGTCSTPGTCTVTPASGTSFTFTYNAALAAAITLTVTNAQGWSNLPSTLTYTASAGNCTSSTGTRTTSGGNTIITFTTTGTDTLNCPSSFTAHILVVAGGGGGAAGGGGAGGYCTTEGTPTCSLGSTVTIPSGNTTVTVGGGGAGSANGGSSGVNGTAGANSVLGTIVTANAGAHGCGTTSSGGQTCQTGGSGGGAGPPSSGTNTGGTGNQGGNGGNTVSACTGGDIPSGGGGGAGGNGGNCTNFNAPGNGGNGISNSINGTATTYAGGGGGSCLFNSNGCVQSSGGSGGGGAGGKLSAGTAGTANRGGGGGGGGNGFAAGAGGSGIVIISCTTGNC